ncbi:tRNA lysidine(34) synthetase TilS [Sulfurimonas sp. HSL-3221]|uniref:tRNA lysidine(34) synthetase TilS n=1 Tax=Sulfurimonadaceae TaxID=2771471 RepID=UPI001E3D6BF5|nr:tRNA lysidine(34) synthetase TilS [Sulfurimonas sp. HSL-3221]UFS63101.1 tRNA lysidine(34) synthetase TilS [Sulfurimonas sp. HSL-3221]
MLEAQTLEHLKAGKNLLAFSAGIDSTALFYLLLNEKIPFDIAHVNYHSRAQSDTEAAHALALAEEYGKACYVHDAETIRENFEAEARRIRYAFFDTLITEHGYTVLLTAHQLDDRLEWLLMQLCKGAGLPELLGMAPVTQREGYRLVRPLLSTTKNDLQSWLDRQGYRYFEDSSNGNPRYKRNRFREQHAGPLLEQYRSGIQNSLAFLSRDAAALPPLPLPAIEAEILMYTGQQERAALMRAVDRWLKQRGYLLRQGEKERMMTENDLVIGRRYALSITPQCTLVTPLTARTMPKDFREECRVLGIGANVRPYLCTNEEYFNAVKRELAAAKGEART